MTAEAKVVIPESVEKALHSFEKAIQDADSLTGFMRYSVGCDLDNLRRAIAAAILRAEIRGLLDGESFGARDLLTALNVRIEEKRAQADALEREGR